MVRRVKLLLSFALAGGQAHAAPTCDADRHRAAAQPPPSPPASNFLSSSLSELLVLLRSLRHGKPASAGASLSPPIVDLGSDADDIAWSTVDRNASGKATDPDAEIPSTASFTRADSAFPPRRQMPEAVHVAASSRQQRVRRAMAHAWSGYKRHAWGDDELEPLTQTGVTSFGMGLTLVDSLDTLIVMGMEAEVEECLAWIDEKLRFGAQEEINLFEVTIRVLGGLLSAYEATGHATLLQRADELGQKLLFAFHTPHGLPFGTLGLRSKTRYNPSWSRGASTVAEVATLQLEFRALSRHTGDPSYEAVASRVMDHLRNMPTRGGEGGGGGAKMAWPAGLPRGLYPMFISPQTGTFESSEITLGARADSLYEYLLKQWLLSGQTDHRVRAMYDESVDAIRTHLVRRGGATRCGNCTWLASWNHKTKTHKDQMDHLACFAPGMLALGAHGPTHDADMQLAKELMATCYRMYSDSVTGLAGEIADFSHASKVVAAPGATHCLLRPETAESLLILWRLTGDATYREWGWRLFEAIEMHAWVATGGFAPLRDVNTPGSHQPRGRMESFFTAETLKYLYLLFGDGTAYPLDEYVFNTEAHPLRIRPEYQYGAQWGSLPGLEELDAMAALFAQQQQQRQQHNSSGDAGAGSGSSNATRIGGIMSGGAGSNHGPAGQPEHVRMRRHAEARAALLAAMPVIS